MRRNTFATVAFYVLCMSINVVYALPEIVTGPIVNPANGHIYYLLEHSSWTDAELKAREMGGHLVTIRNQAENDWVYNTFLPYAGLPGETTQGQLWIGYTDAVIDGVWEWVSGEKSNFENWAPGEPNNGWGEFLESYAMIWGSYVTTHRVPGQWNDLRNEHPDITPRGVVEIIPEPTTLSLLALGGLLLRKRNKKSLI